MASSIQRPTDYQNLTQWNLFNKGPKERRVHVVSETETIYGEAPSGTHEAEDKWIIWREIVQDNGAVHKEYAQNGANNLRWIWNTLAFLPTPDASGRPYYIQLDNQNVVDGMTAGMAVANIVVYDINDTNHVIEVANDPSDKFTVSGNVLYLSGLARLIDVAYPLKLRATDKDGNIYEQWFSIRVIAAPGAPAANYIGELNVFQEATIPSGGTATVLSYTVPSDRAIAMHAFEAFGKNVAEVYVYIDGTLMARKDTNYAQYEVLFDFENFKIHKDSVIEVKMVNNGPTTEYFNARLRGYQYAI